MNDQEIENSHQNEGLQNTLIRNVKSWPVLQPTKQQELVHVSFGDDDETMAWSSLPLRKKYVCVRPYLLGSSAAGSVQLHKANTTQWTATPSDVPRGDTTDRCHFIEQLQGIYESKTLAGRVELSVILGKVARWEGQYAIVRRVTNDGRTLANQRIYDEPFQFSLKSDKGNLEGVFRKGMSKGLSVKWKNPDNESETVWFRKDQGKLNLPWFQPTVRRASISSTSSTDSTMHSIAQSVDKAMSSSHLDPMFMRPRELSVNGASSCPSAYKNVQLNLFRKGLGAASIKSAQHEEEIFEILMARCSENPNLYGQIIDWSMSKRSTQGDSRDEAKSVSEGSVWIVAHTLDIDKGRATQNSLDEIIGVYQKVSGGVWTQHHPQACGSEVKHKLCKDEHGLWKIEQHFVKGEESQIRARQLQDSRWVDLKNNELQIQVSIVPMSRILGLLESKIDVKKSIDFLSTSCKQLKL